MSRLFARLAASSLARIASPSTSSASSVCARPPLSSEVSRQPASAMVVAAGRRLYAADSAQAAAKEKIISVLRERFPKATGLP